MKTNLLNIFTIVFLIFSCSQALAKQTKYKIPETNQVSQQENKNTNDRDKGKGNAQNSKQLNDLISKGEKAYISGDKEKAFEIFATLTKNFPDDYRAFYYCGMILAEKGEKKEAEKMYRSALDRNPSLPEANNNLAVLLQEQKKYEEAEKLLKKALKADPNYYEAQFNLGYLYEEWGKIDDAIEAYHATARIDKKDTEALIIAAQLEEKQNRWSEAESTYRSALERDSSLIKLEIQIASCLRKQGKKAEAIKQLELFLNKVIIAEGSDLNLPFKAAKEMRLAGAPDRALKTLLKFPSEMQKTFSVRAEIAQCYMAIGKCQKAAEIFVQLQKEKPAEEELMLAIGDSYYCAGKCKDAVDAYKNYLAKSKPSEERKNEILKKIEICKKKMK